ncbi:MAG: VOC family protein [Rhodobacteraceae bacterium]|nr:VOC family protein [Paracoccaceae bacterium]MCP5342046.1 VOC family protein [Paracoccaceae bacterium]
MTVRRIVANLAASDPAALATFYCELLDLELLMDHGFINTFGSATQASVQISAASEGGSGTAVPAVSIEVDDLDAVLDRAHQLAAPVEYGPVDEPWGVRRFYLRDPAGSLVNILSHT